MDNLGTLLMLDREGAPSWSCTLSFARVLVAAGTVSGLMAGGYLAGYAHGTHRTDVLADSLVVQEQGILQLSAQLDTVEARYGRITELFGARAAVPPYGWLPPSGRNEGSSGSSEGVSVPSSWPLTERGYTTQVLAKGMVGEHTGVDIAVPTGSYIRAVGGGVVADAGEDPLYGHFVVLDHADGYQSLYAHALVTFPGVGDPVRENEVIALSGSTGRSTAPHLHLEIRKDGQPVDPLAILQQP